MPVAAIHRLLLASLVPLLVMLCAPRHGQPGMPAGVAMSALQATAAEPVPGVPAQTDFSTPTAMPDFPDDVHEAFVWAWAPSSRPHILFQALTYPGLGACVSALLRPPRA